MSGISKGQKHSVVQNIQQISEKNCKKNMIVPVRSQGDKICQSHTVVGAPVTGSTAGSTVLHAVHVVLMQVFSMYFCFRIKMDIQNQGDQTPSLREQQSGCGLDRIKSKILSSSKNMNIVTHTKQELSMTQNNKVQNYGFFSTMGILSRGRPRWAKFQPTSLKFVIGSSSCHDPEKRQSCRRDIQTQCSSLSYAWFMTVQKQNKCSFGI